MQIQSLFENVVKDFDKEEFLTLEENDFVRIERIVSNGQITPKDFWYEQEDNEWVLVIKGKAVLQFEDKHVELEEGAFYNIKAHTKHKVIYTSKDEPTIWLAIFYK